MALACPKGSDFPVISEKYKRQEVIQGLLDQVLHNQIAIPESFTRPEGGFLLIDELLTLPEFTKYDFTLNEVEEAILADDQLRFSVRGSKVRLKPPELNKDRDVIISKKLAWILRHGALKEGLVYSEGGFLYLDEILNVSQFAGITKKEIQVVVEKNNKKRFELRQDPKNPQRTQIRAFQGHSVPIASSDLRPIVDFKEFPRVAHGTYYKNWEAIRKTGLSRMGRTHIHFAPGEVGEAGVISGMRSSAEVIIYLDLELALKDGLLFFISQNTVILSPGDEKGLIGPKYFKEVVDRKTKAVIPLNEAYCNKHSSRGSSVSRSAGMSSPSSLFSCFPLRFRKSSQIEAPNLPKKKNPTNKMAEHAAEG